MRTIILLICISFSCFLHAQNSDTYILDNSIDEIMNPNRMIMTKNKGAYGTKGTPYIYEEFRKGHVYFSNSLKSTGVMINYNSYTDQVLYQKINAIFVLDAKKIDFLEFPETGETSVIFRKVYLDDSKKIHFMEVLYDEHSSLYKRILKEFWAADYTGPYSADRRYDEYSDVPEYYIQLGDGQVRQMKPKKKNVLKIMEAFGREMEEFMKKEKINLKSQDDLVKIMSYYDSLLIPSQ